MKAKIISLSTLLTGAVVSSAAFAETNAAVAAAATSGAGTLTDGIAQIAAVGAAMMGLAATAVVIKWVKASFFG